jgi:P-type E1-E2 ATPase
MDNEMNAYEATVLVDGRWQQVEWQELEVGNIIKVAKDNQIPADVMLISTSTEDGDCFLETSNLDG